MPPEFNVTLTSDPNYPIDIRVAFDVPICMSLTKNSAKNFVDFLGNQRWRHGGNDLNSILLNSGEGVSYEMSWLIPEAVGPGNKSDYINIHAIDRPSTIDSLLLGYDSQKLSHLISLVLRSRCRYCNGTGVITLLTSNVPCECIEAGDEPASERREIK
jgi:hypothetical protein